MHSFGCRDFHRLPSPLEDCEDARGCVPWWLPLSPYGRTKIGLVLFSSIGILCSLKHGVPTSDEGEGEGVAGRSGIDEGSALLLELVMSMAKGGGVSSRSCRSSAAKSPSLSPFSDEAGETRMKARFHLK